MKRRMIAWLLALVMVCTVIPGSAGAAEPETYTYRAATSTLGTNWNPHTWDSSEDSMLLDYLVTPLVSLSASDTELGIYQWVYEAATEIRDVTDLHRDDLEKYRADGNVYEIKLNPDMAWENGTPINADTYIYSMKTLLDPVRENYRANLYYNGSSAVAGGERYFYSGKCAYLEDTTALEEQVCGEDGAYYNHAGEPLYFALTAPLSWLGGESLDACVSAYGETYFDVEAYGALMAMADENGNVAVNKVSRELMIAVISVPDWGEGPGYEVNYIVAERQYPVCTYEDTVGCYKVDEYTIRYVTQSPISINDFLTACSSNWLVYENLYELDGYHTSAATTMSYGPYRLTEYIPQTVARFTRNEAWYGYERAADGSLVSYTNFQVDGKEVQQYQTTDIVITVMDDATAKEQFLNGALTEWYPDADTLLAYSASDRLYRIPETYNMSLFFNTNTEVLAQLDRNENSENVNSLVLSNDSFRRAISLAFDRAELVTATPGYAPSYTLMNGLYYYDVFNDPASSYRNSVPAMEAMCALYGVEWGEGTPYATVREAYLSISGHDSEQAKALMAQACRELVEAGCYTAGETITIEVAWSMGTITDSGYAIEQLMNRQLNAAAEGSGFGTITFRFVGEVENRYGDVPDGKYAIGYGGWGGAAFYPFTNFQLYCDTDMYGVNEAGCWDPTSEWLTLTIGGEQVSMTWQDWSNSLSGTGRFADASNQIKLEITAAMEKGLLEKAYRIPLYSTTAVFLLSRQVDYYTQSYNIMYGFGGLRLLGYHYSDAAWQAYVDSGALDYTTGCDHHYETVVIDATCVEGGCTIQTCTLCGYSYTEESTPIDPEAHAWDGTECTLCGDTRLTPFDDVSEGQFYEEPVAWAVEKGITNGTSATTFGSNDQCLRAHVVTFLHRAAQSPAPESQSNPFTDVKTSDFFYAPVLWAVEQGITNGVSADRFGSYDVCNRAAVVTFLWRAAGQPEPKGQDTPFTDVTEKDFFYKAVLWAVENGITNGISATEFGPTSACNRAQVVTFLYRAFGE